MRTALSLTMTILAMTIIAATSSVATSGNWGQWQNSLKPKGEPGAEIALAVGGKTEYVIVVPENATTQEQKAAEELAYWLKEMTGAQYPVVSDAESPIPTEISVGRTTRLAEAELAVAKEDLGDEGYAIAVQGKCIFLVGGRKRGPIYAALALLEEDLGCRWYSYEGWYGNKGWYSREVNRVLRRPTVRVGVVPRSYVPPLAIRDPHSYDAFDATWSLRNRTNANHGAVPEKWGGHIDYALSVHTFWTLVPPGKYFDEHPEYFSMDESGKRNTQQLCLTNPEIVKIAAQNANEVLDNKPNAELLSVSFNDGSGYCECEQCRALNEAQHNRADSLLHFVNQVAALVEKEHPDVLISTLAYLDTNKPPKNIRPRDNVVIRYCTDRTTWKHLFIPLRWEEGEYRQYREWFQGWTKIHDKVTIWDYVINFSHYYAPLPNMDVVAGNWRFFTENGVVGIFAQAEGSERGAMRNWVYAKLLWDPSRNVRELMNDFTWGYYGKAAPAIADYNQLLRWTAEEHKESMKEHGGQAGCRYPMDAEFLSQEFIEAATVIFDRAEKLAENEEILHRVELGRLPIMYVKLMRGPEFVIERGEDYPALIDRFATIGHREKILRMGDSGRKSLGDRLQGWRDDWQVYNE